MNPLPVVIFDYLLLNLMGLVRNINRFFLFLFLPLLQYLTGPLLVQDILILLFVELFSWHYHVPAAIDHLARQKVFLLCFYTGRVFQSILSPDRLILPVCGIQFELVSVDKTFWIIFTFINDAIVRRFDALRVPHTVSDVGLTSRFLLSFDL